MLFNVALNLNHCNSLLSAHVTIGESENFASAESGASYCMAQASYIDLTSARVATIVRWRCLSQSASPFAAWLGPSSSLPFCKLCIFASCFPTWRPGAQKPLVHTRHYLELELVDSRMYKSNLFWPYWGYYCRLSYSNLVFFRFDCAFCFEIVEKRYKFKIPPTSYSIEKLWYYR